MRGIFFADGNQRPGRVRSRQRNQRCKPSSSLCAEAGKTSTSKEDTIMSKIRSSAGAMAVISLSVLTLFGCGADPSLPGDAELESVAHPIFNGTTQSSPHLTGAVKMSAPAGTCTGQIVSNQFVLTAIHCLGIADSDGNRMIMGPEHPELMTVSNGPDAAGNSLNLTSDFILLNPSTDEALVRVRAPGFAVSRLPGTLYDTSTPPFSSRGELFLKISKTPSVNLLNQQIFRWGYGLVNQSGGVGTLRSGNSTVTEPFVGWYRSPAGTGAVCGGDSGGPDFGFLSRPEQPTGWYLIGVHINGDQPCIGNGVSSTDGAAELRTWIIQGADAFKR
jgi:hypothetical protein